MADDEKRTMQFSVDGIDRLQDDDTGEAHTVEVRSASVVDADSAFHAGQPEQGTRSAQDAQPAQPSQPVQDDDADDDTGEAAVASVSTDTFVMMPQSAPRKAAEHVEDPQPAGAPPSFAVPAAFPAQTLPGEAPSDDRAPQDQKPATRNDRTAQNDWTANDRTAQNDGNARPATPAQDASERRPRHAVMPEMPDLRVRSGDDLDSAADQSRNEFTTVYDILDAIEATLNEGKTGLFTPNLVKVDRDQLSGQIEDLKKKLPVQLERASALMREAERRLAGAQTQASAIVASAQSRAADMIKEANEQAQFLAGQENVVALAQTKARTIVDTAQAKADRLTQGADKYCTEVMESLDQQLDKLKQDVHAGLNVLYTRQQRAAQEYAAAQQQNNTQPSEQEEQR